ncbi:MAG: hypothetical protein IKH13_07445 [Clostridia bacterium]|nr:hypothetical protein [Clostridia bacterium]
MKHFGKIEETGFTLVPNTIIKEGKLSIKALGLYYLIASRPDNWRFSVKGLCSLCSDGYASVNSAVAELEKAGYIRRESVKHINGRYTAGEWTVYDRPVRDNTVIENQDREKQNAENQRTEKQHSEIQFNENQFAENSKEINIEQINNEQTNTDIISLQSEKEMLTEELKNRIDYDVLSVTYGSELLDCICQALTDTVYSGKKTVKINGRDIPLCDVVERYTQLNSENLSFAIDTVTENNAEIKNPVSYWASVLYNAPVDEKLWVESEFKKYKREMGF